MTESDNKRQKMTEHACKWLLTAVNSCKHLKMTEINWGWAPPLISSAVQLSTVVRAQIQSYFWITSNATRNLCVLCAHLFKVCDKYYRQAGAEQSHTRVVLGLGWIGVEVGLWSGLNWGSEKNLGPFRSLGYNPFPSVGGLVV